MDERKSHFHRPVFCGFRVYTIFGVTWPTIGSKELTDYLFKDYEKFTAENGTFETDPIKMAHMMIAHIDKKRKALGIDKARERVLYDMAMRRELEKMNQLIYLLEACRECLRLLHQLQSEVLIK